MHKLEWFFVLALVLYTTAIMSHKETRTLRGWMMVVFGSALTADTLGTFLLCVASAERWQFSVHSVSGLAALLIMLLHFLWGVAAIRGLGNWARQFSQWSVWAWTLWVVAFVSGTPASPLVQLGTASGIILSAHLARTAIGRLRRPHPKDKLRLRASKAKGEQGSVLTPGQHIAAKAAILTYLRGITDQDSETIFYAGRVFSTKELVEEIERETEIGLAHIRMHHQAMMVKETIQ